MAPLDLFNLGTLLVTTLGITELLVVYCPIRDDFRLALLGNSRENMAPAKLIVSVPTVDINIFPTRKVYMHNEVADCGGSGESIHDIPEHVYIAINLTSGRVYPVENITEATRSYFRRDGDIYLVGYENCNATNHCELNLFKAVVPYVTANNITTLDFKNSYITTANIQPTNEYGVVTLFGRQCAECLRITCPDPDIS